MSSRDYRRFMNFLAAHECGVGFREFRSSVPAPDAASGIPAPPAAVADPLEGIASRPH
jgi:hypothetical protein